jgi:hypothetical protein
MTTTPHDIAIAYLDAVSKKELDRVERLLHPDVQFTGPAMKSGSAREFLVALRRIGAIHVRNDVRRVFADGNEVCVIYDFVTDTAGALPAIEWLRIEGGRIRSIQLYYDQVPWLKLREEITRRAQASA